MTRKELEAIEARIAEMRAERVNASLLEGAQTGSGIPTPEHLRHRVVMLTIEGRTVAQIAEELSLGRSTVERIRRDEGVTRRAGGQ